MSENRSKRLLGGVAAAVAAQAAYSAINPHHVNADELKVNPEEVHNEHTSIEADHYDFDNSGNSQDEDKAWHNLVSVHEDPTTLHNNETPEIHSNTDLHENPTIYEEEEEIHGNNQDISSLDHPVTDVDLGIVH